MTPLETLAQGADLVAEWTRLTRGIDWSAVTSWAFIIVGLVGTAVFSGVETGLYCLNRVRLAIRAAQGPMQRAAQTLTRELRDPERMLGANLIANLVFGDMAATGSSRLLSSWGYSASWIVAINVIIFTPVFFILVESVPKELFRIEADRLTYRFAWLLPLTRRVLTAIPALPIVRILTALVGRLIGAGDEADLEASARERVANLVKESAGTGTISTSQAGLVDRALAFQRGTVGEQMRGIDDVSCVGEDATLGQLREAVERNWATGGGAWVPMLEGRGGGSGSARPAVGVVWHADAYLRSAGAIRSLALQPARIPPATPLADAVAQLRRAAVPVGLVENDGRLIGIVTMDDLVEPLLGGAGSP